jgi:integrase
MWGMGRIFQRGRVWWVSYYVEGREYRESSKSEHKGVAQDLLKERISDIRQGKLPSMLTLETLSTSFVADFILRGRKDIKGVKRKLGNVVQYLGKNEKVSRVRTDKLQEYQAHRLQQKAAGHTVNHEINIFMQMLRHGLRYEMLKSIPAAPRPVKTNPPRQGFFEKEEFEAILVELEGAERDIVEFGYYSGWRQGEIIGLTWAEVDVKGSVIRLHPSRSKTSEARLLPLVGPLAELINRRWKIKKGKRVFHTAGKPVLGPTFRAHFRDARDRAGLPHKLFHDFRRTAVRNLVRGGISERVAMQLTGHKTRAVFDRYHIVSESDLRGAMERYLT